MRGRRFLRLRFFMKKRVDNSSPLTKANDNQLLNVFMIFFSVCFGLSVLFAMLSNGETWSNVMFLPKIPDKDQFMDFLNSIRDASGMDVYEKRVIYPPLANMIFFFLGTMIKPELTSTPFSERLKLWTDQRSMLLYIFFVTACLIVLFKIVTAYMQTHNQKRMATLLSVIIVLCYPMLYCIERGNIVLLSVVCSAIFVFFKDSKSKVVRELSFLCLAFAAGIKIYPAILGLLLVFEKRYKEAIRLVIYGVLFFFLPFFFYDGFASIKLLLENVTRFSNKNKARFVMGSVSLENAMYYLGVSSKAAIKLIFILSEVIALICALLAQKNWQKVALLTYMILNIQSASSYYSMIFLLPVVVLFFCEERKKKPLPIDWLYTAFFALIVSPLPAFYHFFGRDLAEKIITQGFGLPFTEQINHALALPVFQVLFLIIIVDVLWEAFKGEKTVKKEKTA